MTVRKVFVPLSLTLALLTPALAGGVGNMSAMTTGVSTAQVSNDTDILFMESATISNLTEITTSQLALKKSTNPAVRAFAQKMIADHNKAQAELNMLAMQKGVKLTDKPGAAQRLQYNKLATLSGAAFDAAYKNVQVGGHDMTLTIIKTYRTFGKDAATLAYAAKIQPVVTMHLAMAKQLPNQ